VQRVGLLLICLIRTQPGNAERQRKHRVRGVLRVRFWIYGKRLEIDVSDFPEKCQKSAIKLAEKISLGPS
jgi:hypothetical protein